MEAEIRMEESWEESQTLIQIAEKNIYVQLIIYSCLASHDKRQEAQQLKGGEKITSFHEDQVVWNQTWFIFSFRGGNVEMFERGAIPQSDDSLLGSEFLWDPCKNDRTILSFRTFRKLLKPFAAAKPGVHPSAQLPHLISICLYLLYIHMNTLIHW